MGYVGRFAPSPTGPLHLGSLVTAVASYLHARQAGGEWLVRIEDVDPPREVPGAATQILRTLEGFGLEWDRSVLYQSEHFALYREVADRLLREGCAFRCRCSRSGLRTDPGAAVRRYLGTCRNLGLRERDTTVRVRVDPGASEWTDGLQGTLHVDLGATTGDYVILRRDGLPAYHLAVVLDDAAQGVTTIVRGFDLLQATPAHIHLQGILGLATPRYFHAPILVNAAGQKLSKQTGAVAIDPAEAGLPARLLALLGATVPMELATAPAQSLWQWAVANWRLESLTGIQTLEQPQPASR